MIKYFSFNSKDPLYDEIVRFIRKHSEEISSILDIGCGNCFLFEKLRGLSNISMTGVEIDSRLVDFCKQKGFDVIEGNFVDVSLPLKSFDFVIAKDVIEHINDSHQFIKKLVNLSRKYIFISAPAPFTDAAWGDFYHIRPYTKTTLMHIAEIFDLKVIELGSIKRKLPFRILAKLWVQPVDDITVYAFYKLK